MFDLITGSTEHVPSRPALPILISVTVQAVVVSTLIAVSALWVTDTLPEIPTMMAFVAAPPAPPPPPPPPAPVVRRAKSSPARAVPTTGQIVAPVEEPARIEPGHDDDESLEEGVPGGVEGGIPGGFVGGVIGGLPDVPPPPPPAPPRGPVRVGGQIETPALVHRVEPEYPLMAVSAHLQGVAILEATVDENGRVIDVRVLRSAGGLLDREAIAAVRQWRYSPLLLNGIRVRFLLTVTLSFQLERAKE